ncbi:MAG: hypothetical protein D6690_14665 [Nitrospirae bacterium]|nr:MAG: hypothetical protein D6690_14665 [Nitrospirota bacterium]
MNNLLHAETLEQIFTSDPPARVTAFLNERWNGECNFPNWERESGSRLFALGLYYFHRRHPDAEITAIAIAAQMLAQMAVFPVFGFGVEAYPLYEQAQTWIIAFAGGVPPPPGGIVGRTPPMNPEGTYSLPGGSEAFTRAAVEVTEALIFDSEAAAERIIHRYLAEHCDELGERAQLIFNRIRRSHLGTPSPCCQDCAQPLGEVFYTQRLTGLKICEACFRRREAQGAFCEEEAS